MSLRSEMLLDAKLIMRDGLMRVRPQAEIDAIGYVENWEQNLLPGIDRDTIEADLGGKGGSELDKKFKAAHSSAALAVNSFAFFRERAQPLPIPGFPPLEFDGFEKLYPTGLNRKPPHLDATAHSGELLVAIESKCLEYFKPKLAKFADAYVDEIADERRDGPWFAEMLRLRERPRDYECLDAAQLIKHAFGLAWTVRDTPVTLLYVFWEPDDARSHDLFARHRGEIATFAERIAGGRPRFQWLSFQELWGHWLSEGSDQLRAHAEMLQSRYCGNLGGYEGYSRVDGRKTDIAFWEGMLPK